jgi:hypothetical protein
MAAIDYALDCDRSNALETLACLCGYFNIAGRNNEPTRRFVELSASDKEPDPVAWARAVSALGLEALWTGATDVAALERARVIAADHGDQWGELLTRRDLALPPSFAGDLGPVSDVMADAARAGMEDIEMFARLQIGSMHNILGHPTATLAALDAVPARMHRLNWDAFASVAQAHCAGALATLGRPADALALVGAIDARTIAVDLLMAETYRIAGLLMADSQLLNQARAALPTSDWIVARIIDANLSYTEALLAGDLVRAARLLEDSLHLAFTPAMRLTADELLAPCLIATGDLDEAHTVCTRLELAAESLHSVHVAAAAAFARAGLAFAVDEPDTFDKAVDAFRAAETSQSQAHLIDAAELVAVALLNAGRAGDAARVDAATRRARTQYSYRWQWRYVEDLRRMAVGSIAQSDRDDLGGAFGDSDAVSLDEAIATVLTSPAGHGQRPASGRQSPRDA